MATQSFVFVSMLSRDVSQARDSWSEVHCLTSLLLGGWLLSMLSRAASASALVSYIWELLGSSSLLSTRFST